MSALAILQARMSSSRLPGKVLQPILGEPMIFRQLERLARASSLDGLVIATSVDESDDELAAALASRGYDVVRGSLDDVLGRYVQVIEEYAPKAVVRLTADCPLASPSVIDQVVQEFLASDLDYFSNTLEPSFPDGVDVEVVKASVLQWVASNSDDIHEHEHVTLGVYRRPERFKVGNYSGPRDLSELRWTVDTSADLDFVRNVYENLYPTNPEFELDDILGFLTAHPELSRSSRDSSRNAALDGLDTGVMKHG